MLLSILLLLLLLRLLMLRIFVRASVESCRNDRRRSRSGRDTFPRGLRNGPRFLIRFVRLSYSYAELRLLHRVSLLIRQRQITRRGSFSPMKEIRNAVRSRRR